MLSRRLTAASALFAFTLASSTAAFAGKKKAPEASARDDDDRPKKVAPEKGPDKGKDLAARVDALEREVHELVVAMKASRGEPKGEPGAFKPQFEGKKLPEGKKPDNGHDDFKKHEGEPHGDKHTFDGKKPAPKPEGGHVELMKGKDGQLYVPVSALPPGIRENFLATAKGGGEEHHEKKAPKKGDDRDGDDRPKDKGSKGKSPAGEK